MTNRPESLKRPVDAQAFGIDLQFRDGLAVPGLMPAKDAVRGQPTTLERDPDGLQAVWSGAISRRTRELRDDGELLLSVDHDDSRGYMLRAPGIGAALISADGFEVRCAVEPEATDWDDLLVGQVLPLVATIRGLEVFHAAGVACGGGAHLLCGAQGVGKTSLAAHLVMGGAELLSDDVVALDDRLIAHPGSTVLRARDPTVAQDGWGSPTGLHRAGEVSGRTRFLADRPARAQPLRRLYFLQRANAGPEIEPVSVPSPVSLLGATFNLSVRTPTRLERHLNMCARMAERVPVFRVRIVPDRSPPELAAVLATHMAQQPAAVA